jgi:hypothetical protein
MAEVHLDNLENHGSAGLWAQSKVVATAESIVELAKDMISPVKCDWGSGAKVECGILLNSWALLRKVEIIIQAIRRY